MKPEICLKYIIRPAVEIIGDARLRSPEAEWLLLATAMYESSLKRTRQVNGPARGLWQFELYGGVRAVMTHHASRDMARALCVELIANPDSIEAVYAALEDDDLLAAGLARLLYWTHPKPLPKLGDWPAAERYYLEVWRPGKHDQPRWIWACTDALTTLQRTPSNAPTA